MDLDPPLRQTCGQEIQCLTEGGLMLQKVFLTDPKLLRNPNDALLEHYASPP